MKKIFLTRVLISLAFVATLSQNAYAQNAQTYAQNACAVNPQSFQCCVESMSIPANNPDNLDPYIACGNGNN